MNQEKRLIVVDGDRHEGRESEYEKLVADLDIDIPLGRELVVSPWYNPPTLHFSKLNLAEIGDDRPADTRIRDLPPGWSEEQVKDLFGGDEGWTVYFRRNDDDSFDEDEPFIT
ncbi:MAG: hypothetical protein J7545_15605 [Roseofilum sp. SBFL]|uniref:hypothetical protein n=1 Tax=Roseofilum sp. SBFL TaxID=2821496 RepID=UPI001B15A90E|nr:hypothetical protein [Roseofilum sp. SBFL]MBP0043373.1 hypothetical protein [Roseofilum sp. SBFL]